MGFPILYKMDLTVARLMRRTRVGFDVSSYDVGATAVASSDPT
jgi:hypothetical protein